MNKIPRADGLTRCGGSRPVRPCSESPLQGIWAEPKQEDSAHRLALNAPQRTATKHSRDASRKPPVASSSGVDEKLDSDVESEAESSWMKSWTQLDRALKSLRTQATECTLYISMSHAHCKGIACCIIHTRTHAYTSTAPNIITLTRHVYTHTRPHVG